MTMPSELNGEAVEELVGCRSGYRTYTREERESHVRDYDLLPPTGGDRGSYLRRANLRRSQIATWRKQLEGDPRGVGGGRRSKRTAGEVEIDRLRKSEAKLRSELERTKAALDIVGKAHALLEMLSEGADCDSKPQR